LTIVEFIHPILSSSHRDLCIAALYYSKRFDQIDTVTVDQIRSLLKRARVSKVNKINIADVLSKSAPFVDAASKQGKSFLYQITSSGEKHIRSLLKISEVDVATVHEIGGLERLINTLSDPDVVNYLTEAVLCLRVDALRAMIVFLWAGVIRTIQKEMLKLGSGVVDAAIMKFDPKSRTIKRMDDFAYIKESTLLLAAQEVGLFDKNERSTLEEALNLRNKCGHPGKYRPGPKKAASFIEDVSTIVFSKFSGCPTMHSS
jgi:hypothetical protein